jgi:NADH-quinone oxidoreductase subunit N
MNTLFLAELVTPNVSLKSILPELIVALAGTIAMVYDSFFPKDRITTGVISLVGLAASAVLLVMMWGEVQPTGAWNGMIAHDNLRLGFSFVFLLVSAMTILVSSVWVERENVPSGEYHALLMFATFGMMLMASGNDLVIIFLGLETLSIATYCHVRSPSRRSQIERVGDEIFHPRIVRLSFFALRNGPCLRSDRLD